MPLYRLTPDAFAPLAPVTYAEARLTERGDLQRLLRDQIDVLLGPADPLLVIAEEFADWEDSARRIDLLAVDRKANLVVIELKVTEDAGHADLQALRYAAMVSAMSFEQAVDAFGVYLHRRGRGEDAREQLRAFLGWADEGRRFAPNVRLVLVAPGFSKELTTTVLWLRDREIDVRCVRVRPHRLDDGTPAGALIADVEQLIPLREAEDFQVRLSRRAQEERAAERSPAPDVAELRRRVEEDMTPAERAGLAAVVTRLEGFGAEWVANPGSLVAQMTVLGARRPHYLFAFRPGRGGEVWFRWLAALPPFSDLDRRRELLARLNRVPGLSITEDRIDKMPTFPTSVLADPAACDVFADVWRWAADVLRAT